MGEINGEEGVDGVLWRQKYKQEDLMSNRGNQLAMTRAHIS